MADVSPAADSRPGHLSGMLFGAGEAFSLDAHAVSASHVSAYAVMEHRSPPLCLLMHLLCFTKKTYKNSFLFWAIKVTDLNVSRTCLCSNFRCLV